MVFKEEGCDFQGNVTSVIVGDDGSDRPEPGMRACKSVGGEGDDSAVGVDKEVTE